MVRGKTTETPMVDNSIPMIEEPIRLKHNRELADKYYLANSLPKRYPWVGEQIQTLPLEKQLYPFGYNPTITRSAYEKMLLCYRYHTDSLSTKLALAEISENGKVLRNGPLELAGQSVEDPKFFTVAGQLHLSWVETKWPDTVKSVVKYSAFKDEKITKAIQLPIGNNDWSHVEKNWCFFERDGVFYCVYQRHPVQKIFRIENEWPTALPETPGPCWPYGAIKGGTAPLNYEGKLLTFCHATLDNDLWQPRRRYYIAACLMNPKPPFEIVQVSKKPVIYGSEDDQLTDEERKVCIQYKRKVVFPGGAVESDGYWLLALGMNDSACVIAKIRSSQLNF